MAQSAPPVADTYANSASAATNYGAQPTLAVAEGNTSYLQFDLSTLPAGATVAKATLRLYVDSVTAGGSFDVDQVNSPWSESTLNFSNAPTPGAPVAGPVSVTAASLNEFVDIDVTALVQDWVNGSVANNGIALVLYGTAGSYSFDSKENTNTSHEPELEIALTGPQARNARQSRWRRPVRKRLRRPPALLERTARTRTRRRAGHSRSPPLASTRRPFRSATQRMVVGQVVYVGGGAGYYTVASLPDTTHVVLTNLGYTGNAATGTIIPADQTVSPGGLAGTGGSGSSGTTTDALTINSSGTGVTSPATFNGSAPVTISFNTIGAAPPGSRTLPLVEPQRPRPALPAQNRAI